MYFCQNLTNQILTTMNFYETIKALRENKKIPQKKLAALLDIDTPMYSRIERGERPLKREQVEKIAILLEVDEIQLINLWLAEKVYSIVAEEDNANEILNIAHEAVVEYSKLK